jgi:hypothetical protein
MFGTQTIRRRRTLSAQNADEPSAINLSDHQIDGRLDHFRQRLANRG